MSGLIGLVLGFVAKIAVATVALLLTDPTTWGSWTGWLIGVALVVAGIVLRGRFRAWYERRTAEIAAEHAARERRDP
jgi:hypothetical protein